MTHPIPAAALEAHIGILAKTGAGKSYLAQGILERLIRKGERCCIIDPTDRYWGLRLLPDRKTPSGLEVVIFGGRHADLPLAEHHGAALAEAAATSATPMIIVTRGLTVGQRTRFFRDFAETLARLNQNSLHLVIDEAHLFAPQGKVSSIQSGEMLHATNELVSSGRGLGLRIMLLTQRAAKLHKDALTQIETLVALRMLSPQDRAAVKDWVYEWADEATGKELLISLPSLPTGTAWVWSPELNVLRKTEVPAITTFDSGKPEEANKKAPALGPIDIAAMRGKLEMIAKEAVENDPKRLKAKIAELERQAKFLPKVEPMKDLKAIEVARQEGYHIGNAEGFANGVAMARGVVGEHLAISLSAIAEKLKAIPMETVWLAKLAALKPSPLGLPPPLRIATPSARPVFPSRPTTVGNGASKPMSKAERSFLTVLAQRDRPLTRSKIAIFAGYSVKSGHIDNTLATLRSNGWAAGGNDAVTITAEGLSALGPFEPMPIGEDLRRHWLSEVDKASRTFLGILIDRYPAALSRDELAKAAGYSVESGHVDNTLARLRSLELANGKNDAVVASSELFE